MESLLKKEWVMVTRFVSFSYDVFESFFFFFLVYKAQIVAKAMHVMIHLNPNHTI